jgi:hypothetical protein
MYLDNADKTKCGTLLIIVHTQPSLKNDQYPKTFTKPNNEIVKENKLLFTDQQKYNMQS